MKLYDTIIRKVEQFTAEERRAVNPMSVKTTIQFICKLTEDKAPLSTFSKLCLALVLLHWTPAFRSAEVRYHKGFDRT